MLPCGTSANLVRKIFFIQVKVKGQFQGQIKSNPIKFLSFSKFDAMLVYFWMKIWILIDISILYILYTYCQHRFCTVFEILDVKKRSKNGHFSTCFDLTKFFLKKHLQVVRSSNLTLVFRFDLSLTFCDLPKVTKVDFSNRGSWFKFRSTLSQKV